MIEKLFSTKTNAARLAAVATGMFEAVASIDTNPIVQLLG